MQLLMSIAIIKLCKSQAAIEKISKSRNFQQNILKFSADENKRLLGLKFSAGVRLLGLARNKQQT